MSVYYDWRTPYCMPPRSCSITSKTLHQYKSLSGVARSSAFDGTSPCHAAIHDHKYFQKAGFDPCKNFFRQSPRPGLEAYTSLLQRSVVTRAAQYQNGSVAPQEERGAPGSGASPELLEKLRQRGVNLPGLEDMVVNVQHNGLTCPFCEGGQNDDKSFSIYFEDSDSALWNCFRGKCGQKGRVSLAEERRRATYAKPKPNEDKRLSEEWLQFFKQRGITQPVLDRNRIAMTPWGALMFRYFRDKEHVNNKYRTLEKRFSQVAQAEKTFYGYDDIKGRREVIIVEGEMDKLAMEVAGFQNVASVPDGAPAKVSDLPLPPKMNDRKYEYVWNSWHALEDAKKIVLATDSDEPGQALAEELARRLGKGRCWKLDWRFAKSVSLPPEPPQAEYPQTNPQASTGSQRFVLNPMQQPRARARSRQPQVLHPAAPPQLPPASLPAPDMAECKDANAVLLTRGSAGIQACVQNATPYPVPEIIRVSDLPANGLQPLSLPGSPPRTWPNLDPLLQITPGKVTLVFGPVMSGKSEFCQAMLCNLAKSSAAHSALCLLDQPDPNVAMRKLDYKLGPMLGQNGNSHQARWKFLEQHFCLIQGDNGLASSLDALLTNIEIANERHKIDVVLLDSLQSLRPTPRSVEAARILIQGLADFAADQALHIILTAHTLHTGEVDALLAACDSGLRLFGSQEDITVSVQANNAVVSRSGEAHFKFEPQTGMFSPR